MNIHYQYNTRDSNHVIINHQFKGDVSTEISPSEYLRRLIYRSLPLPIEFYTEVCEAVPYGRAK